MVTIDLVNGLPASIGNLRTTLFPRHANLPSNLRRVVIEQPKMFCNQIVWFKFLLQLCQPRWNCIWPLLPIVAETLPPNDGFSQHCNQLPFFVCGECRCIQCLELAYQTALDLFRQVGQEADKGAPLFEVRPRHGRQQIRAGLNLFPML